jgi:hypothetical protein
LSKPEILEIREKLYNKLQSWIPQNDALVEKEISIFDNMLTRRDFLKSTSLAAVTALVTSGCSDADHSGPPSTWSEFSDEPTLVGISEKQSVQKVTNIHAHSDLMKIVTREKDIDVHTSTIIEGTAKTVPLVDSYSNSDEGFKQINRGYGHPEPINLEIDNNTFTLKHYEEGSDGMHGLVENVIASGANQNYSSVYGANSSLHNSIDDNSGNVISHKMVLLANESDSQAYENPLMLYYQVESVELSLAQRTVGSDENTSTSWTSIDIIDKLRTLLQSRYDFRDSNESLETTAFVVKEVDNYSDATGNSLLYGTIGFGNKFNFGFVVSFLYNFDTQPTVNFFIPDEFSPTSSTDNIAWQTDSTYNNLVTAVTFLQNNNLLSNALLAQTPQEIVNDFYIFSEQRYRPAGVIMDSGLQQQQGVMFTYRHVSSVVTSDDLAELNNSKFNDFNTLYTFNLTLSPENELQRVMKDMYPKITPNVIDANTLMIVPKALTIITTNAYLMLEDSNSENPFMEFKNNYYTQLLPQVTNLTAYNTYFANFTDYLNQDISTSKKTQNIAWLYSTNPIYQESQKYIDTDNIQRTSISGEFGKYANLLGSNHKTSKCKTLLMTNKDDGSIGALFATGLTTKDGNNTSTAGISLKGFNYSSSQPDLLSVFSHNITFASVTAKSSGNNYEKIWYDKFKSLFGDKSLEELDYEIYCTFNHQELLRSYFVFKDDNNNNAVISFGKNSAEGVEQNAYESGDINELFLSLQDTTESIENFSIPSLIAVNIDTLFSWNRILHDGEVVFSAKNLTKTSAAGEVTYSYNNTNLSYYQASCDSLTSHWNQHQLVSKVSSDDASYSYKKAFHRHQVELELANIYDLPVAPENTLVEIRLSSSGYIIDHTIPSDPRTFKVNRSHGCYLRASKNGKLSIEVELGHIEDKAAGCNIFYRAFDESGVTFQKTSITAHKDNSQSDNVTTGFKSFDLSYQVNNRLTPENFNTIQKTAPSDAPTPQSMIDEYHKEYPQSSTNPDPVTILELQSRYQQLSINGKVDNNSPLPTTTAESTLRSSTNIVNPLTHSSVNINKIDTYTRSIGDDLKDIWDVATAYSQAMKWVEGEIIDGTEDAITYLWSEFTQTQLYKEATAQLLYLFSSNSFFKKIVSFVVATLESLSPIFDFATSFKIGGEFKKILMYHCNPEGEANSIYNFLLEEEDSLSDKIKSSLDYYKQELDKKISDDSANSEKFDSAHNSLKSQNKNIDKTKINYMSNQLNRNSYSSSSDTTVNIDTSKESLLNPLSIFNELSKSTKESVTTPKPGQSIDFNADLSELKPAMLNLAKDIIDDVVTLVEDIEDVITHIPTTFMKYIYTYAQSVPDELKDIFDFLSEIIALLTNNKVTINNILDISIFMLGFVYHTFAYICQDIISDIVEVFEKLSDSNSNLDTSSIDIITPITDGTITTALTTSSIQTQSRSIVQDIIELDNENTVEIIVSAIDIFNTIIDAFFKLAEEANNKEAFGEGAKLKKPQIIGFTILGISQALQGFVSSSFELNQYDTNVKNFGKGDGVETVAKVIYAVPIALEFLPAIVSFVYAARQKIGGVDLFGDLSEAINFLAKWIGCIIAVVESISSDIEDFELNLSYLVEFSLNLHKMINKTSAALATSTVITLREQIKNDATQAAGETVEALGGILSVQTLTDATVSVLSIIHSYEDENDEK